MSTSNKFTRASTSNIRLSDNQSTALSNSVLFPSIRRLQSYQNENKLKKSINK